MPGANSYDTTTFVSNVQLIAHIPLSNATFNAPEIINLGNRELQTSLISQILSAREGYYLKYVDYDPTLYPLGLFPIPPQAIGGALEAVQIVVDPSIIPVNRLEQSEQFSTQAPTSTSYGYFIQGNLIQVLPAPTMGGVLRIWFTRRPNTLTATSAAGYISAINGAVITVSALPSTFAVGTLVDLCQAQPTFDVLGEREVAAISGTDVTLDAAVDDLVIGDYLCLANQTPVPQIPVEFRPLLEQRVAVMIYELQGYLDKMKAAGDKLKRMEEDLFKLIAPRVHSQTKVVNPQNGGFTNNNGRYASLYWSNRR